MSRTDTTRQAMEPVADTCTRQATDLREGVIADSGQEANTVLIRTGAIPSVEAEAWHVIIGLEPQSQSNMRP